MKITVPFDIRKFWEFKPEILVEKNALPMKPGYETLYTSKFSLTEITGTPAGDPEYSGRKKATEISGIFAWGNPCMSIMETSALFMCRCTVQCSMASEVMESFLYFLILSVVN